MLKTELKRVLFKNKMFVLIIVLLFLKIISLGYDSIFINTNIEVIHDNYIEYVNTVKGKLTAENEEKILKNYTDMFNAQGEYSTLKTQYEQNLITTEEYRQKVSEINPMLENTDLYTIFHEEYKFAKENPRQRYVMYTNGWEAFLANERLDFLLLFGVIIFTCMLFVFDEETGVSSLIKTSVNGRSKLFKTRHTLLILSITALNAAFFVSEFAFFGIKYGLTDWDYPIQSLISFRTSPFNISIFSGMLIIFLFKLLGSIFIAETTILIANLTKKIWLTTAVNLAFVLIPYALFNTQDVRYYFQPLGFLLGSNYLKGKIDYILNKGVLYSGAFGGISANKILILFYAVVVLSFGIFVISKAKNSLKSSLKTIRTPVFLCVISLITANVFINDITKVNVYNFTESYSKGLGYSDENFIYMNMDEFTAIDVSSPENAESFNVIRDISKSKISKNTPLNIFCDNENLYYMMRENETRQTFFYKINKKNFSEEKIFTELGGVGDFDIDTKYLGLIDTQNIDNSSMAEEEKTGITTFWVDNNYLFIAFNSGIDMINLENKKRERIIESEFYTDCIAYNKGIIYYTNLKNEVFSYDIKTSNSVKLPIEKSFRLYCFNDNLYFLDFNRNLFLYENETGKSTKLSDICVNDTSLISANKENIYFVNTENKIVKLDILSYETEIFNNDFIAYNVYAFDGYDNLYVYCNDKDNFVWKLI